MKDRYKIKITGVNSQLGHNGGARFQVCDPNKNAWVTPSFARSPYELRGWLLLDQTVYELAQGIYVGRTDPEQRTACARLQLADPSACQRGVLEVNDIEELWLEDPSSTSSPPAIP